MPKLVNGKDLNLKQRQQVLNAFVYRWTTGNSKRTSVYKCELCDIRTPYENSRTANGHTHPTIPLLSDSEWLSDHNFYINKDGSLSDKPARCEPVY